MKKKDILFGLLAALLLAIVVSPFASSWPDGLERVAEDKGFIDKADVKPVVKSLIPDYIWPGMQNEHIATSAAGTTGTIIVFICAFGIGYMLRKR